MLKHTENELKLPQSFQTFSQKAPLNTCLFKFVFFSSNQSAMETLKVISEVAVAQEADRVVH